jgi:hypothetical protein
LKDRDAALLPLQGRDGLRIGDYPSEFGIDELGDKAATHEIVKRSHAANRTARKRGSQRGIDSPCKRCEFRVACHAATRSLVEAGREARSKPRSQRSRPFAQARDSGRQTFGCDGASAYA